MKIAILGLGTVGSGVLEILKKIENLEVVKTFERKITSDLSTTNINEIINDESINLVVETLGGISPAYEYICAALKNGKHVVTANKAVVARYLDEFLKLAKENNVAFLFEASVAGGIPWIASLEKAKRIDTITSLYGIMNGTSNFIIDYMYNHDADFDNTLLKAQKFGYAEKDPSADIDGDDVVNKLIVSCAIAHDILLKNKIPKYSMRNLKKVDIDFLKSKNLSTKFIGEINLIDSKLSSSAMLNIISNLDIENSIHSNFNIVSLVGDSIGELKFYGQGAGKLATANAIVQDILDIHLNSNRQTLTLKNDYTFSTELENKSFLIRSNNRIENDFIVNVEEFNNNFYHYTDKITFSQLNEILESIDNEYLVAKFR